MKRLEMAKAHGATQTFCGTAADAEEFVKQHTEGRLADVGSGGGFPGIPLKIARPELEVFLIESNLKKATFLAEIVRELGLTDMHILVSRYQELGEELAPLNTVCSRALGEFGAFLKWAGSPQVACDQVVLWIGGRDLDEVRQAAGWEWHEPVPVPHSLRRLNPMN